jgi:hypothetical protein
MYRKRKEIKNMQHTGYMFVHICENALYASCLLSRQRVKKEKDTQGGQCKGDTAHEVHICANR